MNTKAFIAGIEQNIKFKNGLITLKRPIYNSQQGNPVKEFAKLWKVQRFLFTVETERQAGKIHPQIQEIRNLSGQYQQALFQYPVINNDLL